MLYSKQCRKSYAHSVNRDSDAIYRKLKIACKAGQIMPVKKRGVVRASERTCLSSIAHVALVRFPSFSRFCYAGYTNEETRNVIKRS